MSLRNFWGRQFFIVTESFTAHIELKLSSRLRGSEIKPGHSRLSQ